MYLIRSIAQAQSGRRDEAVAQMKEMAADMQEAASMPPSRILTASIGPADSTVIMESEVDSLAQFEQQMAAFNKSPNMARYGKMFAELFIAGTHRFEVYRIQS